MQRRHFLTRSLAATAGLATLNSALATGRQALHDALDALPAAAGTANPQTVRHWAAALNAALAASATDPTVASRACAMVFEAIYNAWACYQPGAAFTVRGLARRPPAQHTTTNQAAALSHAAHAVLVDLFANQRQRFDTALAQTAGQQPAGEVDAMAPDLGRQAASALLALRHADGANQTGRLSPGAYADPSGYRPVNTVDCLANPHRWQPLAITNLAGQRVTQTFLTPHWGNVRTFALPSGSAVRPDLGVIVPTAAEMQELVQLGAALTDTHKATVDHWAANPGSVTPSGMWIDIAARVCAHDQHTLSDDVRMYFALGGALLDAGIACWDAKRAFDSARPITAIRHAWRGRTLPCWGGPGQGTVLRAGDTWMPYQRSERPTPNFPEFPSGHSSFSFAAATVLAGLRGGGDALPLHFSFPAGGVPFDPTVPASAVPLAFASLSEAAASAAFSRRLGGIHFERGDLHGRLIGQRVGQAVLTRCRRLFSGDQA